MRQIRNIVSLLDPKNTWSATDYIFFLTVLLLFSSSFLPQRLTSAFLIVSFGVLLISKQRSAIWLGLKNSRIFHVIILYILIFSISALSSEDVWEGVKQLEKKVPLVLAPLIFFSPILDQRIRKILLRVFIWSWGFAALYAIIKTFQIYNFETTDSSLFFYVLPAAVFDMGSNYFALFISFCFVMMLIGLSERYMKRNFLNFSLTGFLFIFLAMLSSRTAFFSAIFICVLYLIYIASGNKQKRNIIIVLIGLFVLTAVIATQSVPYLRNRIAAIQIDERPTMMRVGWEIASENIMLGVGIGDVSNELQKKFTAYGYTNLLKYHHIHNDFLHHLMAVGVVGFLIYLVMLGLFFRKAILDKNLMGAAFLLLFTLASQTEVLSTRHLGLLFFSMMFSLFFVHSYEKKDSSY